MKRFIFTILAFLPVLVFAGAQDGTLIRRGVDYGCYMVQINSTTPTQVAVENTKRVDLVIRSTSTYDIFVCSATYATKPTYVRTGAFPIKSGERLRSDGFFPGSLYLIGGENMPPMPVSILEFYRQEY